MDTEGPGQAKPQRQEVDPGWRGAGKTGSSRTGAQGPRALGGGGNVLEWTVGTAAQLWEHPKAPRIASLEWGTRVIDELHLNKTVLLLFLMSEQALGRTKPSRTCEVNFREGPAAMTSSRTRSRGATGTGSQDPTAE